NRNVTIKKTFQHEPSSNFISVLLVYFKKIVFQCALMRIMTLVVCNLTFICFSFSAPVENTNIQTKKNLIQHEQKTSPSFRPEKSDFTSDEALQFFFSYEESFTIRASVGLNFKE